MDSPLAYSVAGEADDGPIPEQSDELSTPVALPWPPTALYAVPVAKSFAEVGKMVSGADLRQSPN